MEFGIEVCIGCLLWQKRYIRVGKLVAEEDTNMRLVKKMPPLELYGWH